ncbi:MAG TPA: radical SAM protein [Thermoanaerobaculia bacterium]|nr:radical SAM protein [Thermoanaerobaculia bacterium]
MSYDPHPIVQWELTRLCDQHCRGCPTGASEQRDPNELSTYEAYKTIDQIAALRPREVIITGGDPLQREDVYQIVDYARRRGLDPSLVLTASRELTFDALAKLVRNGLTRAVFSVDEPSAPVHAALRFAVSAGLRIEINTLVLRNNAADLGAIAALVRSLGAERWNVYFQVPVRASRELPMLTADEVERVFASLEEIRLRQGLAIRTVEAPHYRRFRVQRILESWQDFTGQASDVEGTPEILDSALDGARSFVYVSHAGDVRASELAPQSAGNLRYRELGAIYRGSDLFVALRDPDNLHGRCGRCEFRILCGGSRARAYAMTGDLFGADPLCAWDPSANRLSLAAHGKEADA